MFHLGRGEGIIVFLVVTKQQENFNCLQHDLSVPGVIECISDCSLTIVNLVIVIVGETVFKYMSLFSYNMLKRLLFIR